MKTLLSIFILAACWCNISMAQTAGDVLEHGIKIQPDKKIFFFYDQNDFKVYVGKSLEDKPTPRIFYPLKTPQFICCKAMALIFICAQLTH